MKNLKQNLIAGLLVIGSVSFYAQSSMGAIKGEILSSENLPVIGATVKVTQGGVLIGGATTDESGRYTYKPLNAGSYDVIVSSFETQTKKVINIRVSSETTTYVDVSVSTNTLTEIEIIAYVKPIIDKSFINIKEITSIEFSRMAVDRGNITDAIINISAEVTKDSNGDLHVRGSRGDATAYIVDGVKSPNISGVPALSVENVSIITGGIPAQYGDNTSGVIVVTTKDYFSGIQNKHMQSNYITENKERIKREKEALQLEKLRKKEIEEELRLEKEANEKKG